MIQQDFAPIPWFREVLQNFSVGICVVVIERASGCSSIDISFYILLI